jgi:hypothetical protein
MTGHGVLGELAQTRAGSPVRATASGYAVYVSDRNRDEFELHLHCNPSFLPIQHLSSG